MTTRERTASARFRLTAMYSLFLFGLAAFVVGGIYLAIAARLDDQPVSRKVVVVQTIPGPGGQPVVVDADEVRVDFENFEQEVNQRALQLLRTYSFGALALLFLASLLVGWIVAGRVLAPIDRITAVAREIQATDLSRRIAMTGPDDELKDLADTFDGMLERIDDAFASQQRFIQEASHELRNPLAVIRTNLDVVLSDPDATPEDLRHTAEVVQRTAERMSQLVDDLLAYGREGAPARTTSLLDVGDVVTDTVAEFVAPASERSIEIVGVAAPGLRVLGDRVALRQAVANLLANAVRLAPVGSTIHVTALAAQAEPGRSPRVEVQVADEGPGIVPADRARVFDRFWRGDRRRARAEGRSGLGLTIVRQIAEAHRGGVSVEGNQAGGSTFTLWFPPAS